MGGGAFKELKQEAGWVAQDGAFPEHAEAVVCGCQCVLAILTVAVSVHAFHAAAHACQIRVETVGPVLVTGVRAMMQTPVTPTNPASADNDSM